jgi:hypothetical protein
MDLIRCKRAGAFANTHGNCFRSYEKPVRFQPRDNRSIWVELDLASFGQAILAVFAAFEREILGERVRAGLAHAWQNGKQLGRPLTAGLHAGRIRKIHRSGLSKAEISRLLNIGRTWVRGILTSEMG